jgi:hypothetical protein
MINDKLLQPAKEFNDAYEAGYDCAMNGADKYNTHCRFFLSRTNMQQWEIGKRVAELEKKNFKK